MVEDKKKKVIHRKPGYLVGVIATENTVSKLTRKINSAEDHRERKESEVPQSCLTFATPWTAAHQAPLSMGFSRQEYRSGWPLPSPGILPDPGIEPRSHALQAHAFTI